MSVAIEKNTVVSLSYELADTDGVVLEKTDSPITYLHGGHHGIFPRVEEALEGKRAGDECSVRLEPEDAFGDYDEERLFVEPRSRYGDGLEQGMQIEDDLDGDDDAVSRTARFGDLLQGRQGAVLRVDHCAQGSTLLLWTTPPPSCKDTPLEPF